MIYDAMMIAFVLFSSPFESMKNAGLILGILNERKKGQRPLLMEIIPSFNYRSAIY